MKFFAIFLLAASAGFSADFMTGQGARFVFGQLTFSAQDSGASSWELGAVGGVAYANNMLIVADSNRIGADPANHRVMIFGGLDASMPKPTDELQNANICNVCGATATVVLGQKDFDTTGYTVPPTSATMRSPTAVASDGVRLAVADTDNNRVLIWNTIPTANKTAPNVVLGQPDFISASGMRPPTASSLSGPQGVWIQDGKLFVADTYNNRILIWNSIPTTNGAPADVVLGQPNFTSLVQPDLTQVQANVTAQTLTSPVSVTSDGTRVYVADLGDSRVLIWNSIPTVNQRAADVVVGQADMASSLANNSAGVCDSTGVTLSISAATNGVTATFTATSHGLSSGQAVIISGATGSWTPVNGRFIVTVLTADTFAINVNSLSLGPLTGTLSALVYPTRCAATLDFPRYALSDGKWLFIADGGNDRILVYRQVPTANGQAADIILGQPNGSTNVVSEVATIDPKSTDIVNSVRAAVDVVRTPLSLAWDGLNLYVADPFNRRVLVFTTGEIGIPYAGVRNSASRRIHASGYFDFVGTPVTGDKVTLTIAGTDYVYTAVSGDTTDKMIQSLLDLINAGSGNAFVLATPNFQLERIILTARVEGDAGNEIPIAVAIAAATTSATAGVTVTASSTVLQYGDSAARIAPGTLVMILGQNLADQVAVPPPGADPLPTTLGGVQVYFDGVRAPLLYVSPTQINAQIQFEAYGRRSLSAYVRVQRQDGSVFATNAVAVPIVDQNPGIFAFEGTEPRAAVAVHYTSFATGTVSVDGTVTAGNVVSVTIEDRTYSYTVQTDDTLVSIRDALVALINQGDPVVEASPSAFYSRIRLKARVPGPAGNGIPISGGYSSGSDVIVASFGSALCCASEAGSLVTVDNPAFPGETIAIYATGLGLVTPDAARNAIQTGAAYQGPAFNDPVSAIASSATALSNQILSAGLKPGWMGVYEIQMELNVNLLTDANTQILVFQSSYISNPVTIPVFRPGP
jgi:hypothetical protein